MASSAVDQPELTAEQVQRILVKPLEQASVLLAAGPRLFDVTAAGVVRIPKLVSMGAPAWHGEHELDHQGRPDFGEVVLLNGTESLKSIARFSNELARSSVVALDAALRDRMVLDVAATIDQAFFTGTAGEPLGLLNHTGVQSVAPVCALDLDDLLDAVALVYTANVDTPRLRWVRPSRTFISIRKLKDSSGKYLVEPDATQDATFRLFGIPVLVTNRIATNGGAGTNEGSVVLADFSQITVARDLGQAARPDLRRLRPAGDPGGRPLRRRAAQPRRDRGPAPRDVVTWVEVAEGQAVDHDGRQLGPGIVLDVEDRLAGKWLERQVVLPARHPAKKASKTNEKAQRPAPAVEPPGRGVVTPGQWGLRGPYPRRVASSEAGRVPSWAGPVMRSSWRRRSAANIRTPSASSSSSSAALGLLGVGSASPHRACG